MWVIVSCGHEREPGREAVYGLLKGTIPGKFIELIKNTFVLDGEGRGE
jgi:hypothetical protein